MLSTNVMITGIDFKHCHVGGCGDTQLQFQLSGGWGQIESKRWWDQIFKTKKYNVKHFYFLLMSLNELSKLYVSKYLS